MKNRFNEIEEVGNAMSCSLTLYDNIFEIRFALTLVSLNAMNTSKFCSDALFDDCLILNIDVHLI